MIQSAQIHHFLMHTVQTTTQYFKQNLLTKQLGVWIFSSGNRKRKKNRLSLYSTAFGVYFHICFYSIFNQTLPLNVSLGDFLLYFPFVTVPSYWFLVSEVEKHLVPISIANFNSAKKLHFSLRIQQYLYIYALPIGEIGRNLHLFRVQFIKSNLPNK